MVHAQILVVEDESIAAMHIQRALQNMGYGVPAVVSSGEEAIQKAAETQPDLVLMDINLKGQMDGVEAAKHIHSNLNVPIIYLTAMSDEDTLRRAKITEPLGYILKPFDERNLRVTIEIALYKHEVENSLKEKTAEQAVLLEVARILAQPVSFQEKCNSVLKALTRIAQADLVILRVLENKEELRVAASAGAAGWAPPEALPLHQSLSGKAYAQREPVIANDYPSHPLANPSAVAHNVKSLASLPIKAGMHTLGVISVFSRQPNHFTPQRVRVLSAIADGLGEL